MLKFTINPKKKQPKQVRSKIINLNMSTKRSSTKKNQNTASNTPSKANNNRVPDLVDDESPAPGSKEFVLLRNAQQGEKMFILFLF